MTYTTKIRGKRYEAATLEELSQTYCEARENSGLGASKFTSAPVFEKGKPGQIGYIAYNGRIFEGLATAWTPATKMLYDNREDDEVDVSKAEFAAWGRPR